MERRDLNLLRFVYHAIPLPQDVRGRLCKIISRAHSQGYRFRWVPGGLTELDATFLRGLPAFGSFPDEILGGLELLLSRNSAPKLLH
jgi:hypothetical protein